MLKRLEKNKLERKQKQIKQLLGLAIEGDKLIPTLFEELRQFIPSTSNTFIHVNEAYRITNIYDDCPDIAQYVGYYSSELLPKVGANFHPRWEDWLKLNNKISNNSGFVYDDFYESEYYHEFMRPLCKHDSLIAPVKSRDLPCGVLVLTRSKQDSFFSAAETKALSSLVPHIADCLSRHYEPSNSYYKQYSGTLLFDLKPKLIHASNQANAAIKHVLQGSAIRASSMHTLPSELLDMIKNYIRLYQTGESKGVPSCLLKTRWYNVECRASWLEPENREGGSLISVTLYKVFPENLYIWQSSQHLGLTTKQWLVVFLILKGLTHEEIAKNLTISYHTVIDHMKIIFQKAGVKNRGQLVSKLLGERT